MNISIILPHNTRSFGYFNMQNKMKARIALVIKIKNWHLKLRFNVVIYPFRR